jgi:SAM-dependent methyltransferase
MVIQVACEREACFRSSAPPIPPVNIWGERNVEWSFLSKEMPDGPGEALEFGCEQGYMSLLAAQKASMFWQTIFRSSPLPGSIQTLNSAAATYTLDFPKNYFDLAINCSSVEHVGVAGRYGITAEQSEGDVQVMQRLADVLKPGGILLMTAPCGRDAVMAPWCRVYGAQRLPKLFAPFQVAKESYWIKDLQNRWVSSTRETALDFKPVHSPSDSHGCAYALGCFVLKKV